MRNSLVTGASRGIGRAIAIALAARGDRVAVHYATGREAAEQTLSLLDGDGHVLIGGDVSEAEQAAAVVDHAVTALGGIDVLVNNAAVAPGEDNRHAVADVSYADWQRAWRRMVDVDLIGAANVTYCFAQHLIGRGAPGAVVNVGSRGAFRGEPDYPAYGAAKAGLHAFGQSMAVALAPHGIAVTSVAPGFVSTDRQAGKLAGAAGPSVLAESPFGRVGTPEEVGAAVAYLSSAEATWASGTILDLNGASHLRT
ncbi:SDR family NAD(P)-dependent oxidoreductase [Actinoplanes friuliensis]|uniref:Short-chain dehydrogenase/reductase SDR n=1 Tax=Actinoplanes friuliensis DSM 7358 TaxID=1246995 RepID=U5W842_9ACTN|nr:SDR family oxidoreductase [Actinoplanes friuliensis]AGZ44140.1 short-chain dehydrogenase/reductase SDR [Actinoplanes friuliensis DSM 7358]